MITKTRNFKDEYIVIAIDSTGIKVTNRGQWMRDKWHIKNKKGYLKIHVSCKCQDQENSFNEGNWMSMFMTVRHYQSWLMVL